MSPSEVANTVSQPHLEPHNAFGKHLEEILASKFFITSKRSSSMLRYVVTCTLRNDVPALKERTIGIEVFNRSVDYETNTDPVVRNAAAEIRKRLAMYYSEHTSSNVKISLSIGSYTPSFTSIEQQAPPEIALPIALPKDNPRTRRTVLSLLTVISVVLLAIGSVTIYIQFHVHNGEQRFWSPWVDGQKDTLLCLGNIEMSALSSQPRTVDDTDLIKTMTGIGEKERIGMAEVQAVNSLSQLITSKRKKMIVRTAAATSIEDLQEYPSILVGGRTNQWTMRSMEHLPFRIVQGVQPGQVALADAQDQLKLVWSDDLRIPVEQRKTAYGLVARFKDPRTDQFSLVLAGLGPNGTTSAVRFVTNPAQLRTLSDQLAPGWEKRNLEVILTSELIDGKQSPPHVLKVLTW